MKKNYIDDQGNYINIENLTLAEIYYKGVEEGRKASEQVADIGDTAYWKEPKYKSPDFDLVVCSRCLRPELRRDTKDMDYCPGCGRRIAENKDQAEADAEARREAHNIDDNEGTLKWKGLYGKN